jgi:hypothetical protein
VKEFAIYTGLRLALFVVTYAVLAGLWAALVDGGGQAFIWPFVGAVIISSLLSLRLLKGPRERFAEKVEARASRAAAKFEEIRTREDTD